VGLGHEALPSQVRALHISLLALLGSSLCYILAFLTLTDNGQSWTTVVLAEKTAYFDVLEFFFLNRMPVK